ncbi:MAG: glycosyltransferase [Bacteroidota bacterium]
MSGPITRVNKLKKNNVRILMEIPSYPYDDEYKGVGFSLKIIKRVEEVYRRYFYKYVDRMVTYSTVHKIFGVDTIKINNGIDIKSIPLRKKLNKGADIHLLAVAVVNVWHGYDRIFEGLKSYYKNTPKTKVYLHIVGDGEDDESKKYRFLVKKYQLEDYVLFYGFRSGDDLNVIFDKADFAVGSIGVHRIGLINTNPIKFGEYAARGIPFLYSGIYDLFEDQPFIYKVSNDETAVNISDLVGFINRHQFNGSDLRKFAEENLTWEIQMKKIIDEVTLIT